LRLKPMALQPRRDGMVLLWPEIFAPCADLLGLVQMEA